MSLIPPHACLSMSEMKYLMNSGKYAPFLSVHTPDFMLEPHRHSLSFFLKVTGQAVLLRFLFQVYSHCKNLFVFLSHSVCSKGNKCLFKKINSYYSILFIRVFLGSSRLII